MCRLLFATTNHIERLDPALSRPGRMDVWVNFTNATKWQAEGIFQCFFPSAKASAKGPVDASQRNLPGGVERKKKATTHAVPLLSEEEIAELAKRFGQAIPEDELSVSRLLLTQAKYSSDAIYSSGRLSSGIPTAQ